MLIQFNDAADKIGRFAYDAALKFNGQYSKKRMNNNMMHVFHYAYVHSSSTDENMIRTNLERAINENYGSSLPYDMFGSFTIDDVMNLVKDLPEEQKITLHEARISYQEHQIKTDWEETFFGIDDQAEPA